MKEQDEHGLSFHEKKHIFSIIGTVLTFGIYSYYVYTDYQSEGPETAYDLKFWAMAILILIPVSIVAKIILEIIFQILNSIATRKTEQPIRDERDKLIELRAIRNANWIFIFGFFLGIGAIALDQTPAMMFIITALGGFVADIFGEITRIHFYRRGF